MAKILVIDDEATILKFCHTLLTASNFEVLAALNITQGLYLAKSGNPELILADLNMPGENNLSVIETLRSQCPQIPIIIFSGVVTQEIEKKAFKMGVKDVINKPSSSQELVGRISKILKISPLPKQAPAVPPTNQTPVKSISSEQSEVSGGQKILIVDDDPSIRNLLVEFLRTKNLQVLQASCGAEAIEVVRKEKPILMLLDVSMPGMNGIETLRKIREFNQEIGVVMATANEDEDTAKEAAELGTYQYVLKPFDLKYLELVVLTRLFMA